MLVKIQLQLSRVDEIAQELRHQGINHSGWVSS